MKRNKSFTLIELLVVIAVIGLFASIVLVVLRDVGERARIAKTLEFSHSINHVLGAYAVGIWDFERIEQPGNRVTDRSGYGNDGTVHGAELVSGLEQLGNALSFDGVGDYVRVVDDASLDVAFGTLIWTKEAWAYPRGWANWATIVDKMTGAWWSNSLGGIWASDCSGFSAAIGSGEPGNPPGCCVRVTFKPPLNAWYHIVAVADGERIYLYLNGELKGSRVITDYIKNTLTPNDAPVIIGRRTVGAGPSFNGLIDEVRIYNRALKAAEIQKLYAEGAAKRGLTKN